jgi:hypothetical protein
VIGHFFSGKSGRYFWMGASKSRRPLSYSRPAAVAVIDFEMLPTG